METEITLEYVQVVVNPWKKWIFPVAHEIIWGYSKDNCDIDLYM